MDPSFASPAAATRPAGTPSPRRIRSPPEAASPPSPMMFAEATAQQLETQQLREMVAALCLEVAALKAAGTSVGEGRDNIGGDVEDAAQASGRRVRVIDSQGEWQPFVDAEEVDDQAQHFIGSPNADDQPEQAWQDPWRSQDPWTPDASRYPVPSWDHNATPDASRYPVPW